MKLIIDDANIEKIKEVYDYFPVDGVTTNPSILAKSGRNPYEVLKEIREFIGEKADLHVQVVSTKADDMVEEAMKIREVLGDNTYIKVPSVKEGFKAMKALKEQGVRITATAIYSPMQAFLAAKCGADYAAPYINRIDNLGYNGVETAKKIHEIFKNNGFKTEVLAASFKNSNQVLELAHFGVGASTCSCDVIETFVKDKNVDMAIGAFIEDFESIAGNDKTMLDA